MSDDRSWWQRVRGAHPPKETSAAPVRPAAVTPAPAPIHAPPPAKDPPAPAPAGTAAPEADDETTTQNSQDFLTLPPEGRRALVERYRGNAHPERFPWRWGQVRYNRIAMINHLLARKGPDAAYLEIGCGGNELFDSVPVADKTGVDPVKGGTVRLTSDDFFAQNTRTFDVIWIDGLHEYEQVHKDVANALDCLAPGGWIGLHDMLPLDWLQEHMPRISLGWTGDVWKVAFEIAATPGLDFRVALIDHGVGVLRRTGDPAPLADMSDVLDSARFAWLHENIDRLPLAEWPEVHAWSAS